ncbi:hypothetical protein GCM10023063_21040 [Arthrobacter methylotrophus]
MSFCIHVLSILVPTNRWAGPRPLATDPSIHLIQRTHLNARTGEGGALNSAYSALDDFLPPDADRDKAIVCVVNADGEMAANTLEQVAGRDLFGDPAVGAAQIIAWMKNRNDRSPLPELGRLVNAAARYLIRMQDMEFRNAIAAQSLCERTRTVGLGGNSQFTRWQN